jgi:hypothetical protein
MWQIPVTAQSKAWVYVRSLARIVGSNPARDVEVSLVSVVCCEVQISASELITHTEESCQAWCV